MCESGGCGGEACDVLDGKDEKLPSYVAGNQGGYVLLPARVVAAEMQDGSVGGEDVQSS